MTKAERNAMFDACFDMTTIFAPAATGPVEKGFRGRDRPDLYWKNGQRWQRPTAPNAETKEQLGGISSLRRGT